MTTARAVRLLAATIGLALVALAGSTGTAAAAVKQTFEARITKASASGAYSFTFDWSTSDPAGGVPPAITGVQIRMPKGAQIQRSFLRPPFVCGDILKPGSDAAVCRRSQLSKNWSSGNSGTWLSMDFRPFLFGSQVRADLYAFLAKPVVPGAVAALKFLAIPDASNSFVRSNPSIMNTKPVLVANVFNDPQGPYGYRIDLPVDFDAPVLVSVQQFHAEFPGIKAHGKFWITTPNCHSSTAKFEATFDYVGESSQTKTAAVRQRFGCKKT